MDPAASNHHVGHRHLPAISSNSVGEPHRRRGQPGVRDQRGNGSGGSHPHDGGVTGPSQRTQRRRRLHLSHRLQRGDGDQGLGLLGPLLDWHEKDDTKGSIKVMMTGSASDLSRASTKHTSGVSKARINVRLSGQHKCPHHLLREMPCRRVGQQRTGRKVLMLPILREACLEFGRQLPLCYA